jgi:hypothetical protein
LPVGLAGSEDLFPIGEAAIRPARASAQIGRPIPADALLRFADGDRRVVMDAIGLAIAEVLPPSYRGVYASVTDFPRASEVLRESRSITQSSDIT